MLSSPKHDSKQDARFASRLDVLTERLDTLAATVATTASSIAKTDGEIAGLRRDLQTTLTRVEAGASAGGGGTGSAELRELAARVAALTADRSTRPDDGRFEDLSRMVLRLGERVDTLAAAPPPELGASGDELERLGARLESALAEIRAQVEGLPATTPEVEQRLAEVSTRASELDERFAGQQMELESARRQFAEAGARIEQIVGELRHALVAIQTPRSEDTAFVERVDQLEASVAHLGGRVDELEEAAAASSEPEPDEEVSSGLVALASLATEIANASDQWTTTVEPAHAGIDDRLLVEVRAYEQPIELAADAVAIEHEAPFVEPEHHVSPVDVDVPRVETEAAPSTVALETGVVPLRSLDP